MGLLTGILNLIRRLWKLIKKYWWVIALILLVIFIWFPGTWALIASYLSSAWTAISTFAATNGWGMTAAIGLGALAVVDPQDASNVVKEIGDSLGTVAGAVGDAAGSVLGGLFSSPLGWIAIGVGAWLLLSHRKDKDTSTPLIESGGSDGNAQTGTAV